MRLNYKHGHLHFVLHLTGREGNGQRQGIKGIDKGQGQDVKKMNRARALDAFQKGEDT